MRDPPPERSAATRSRAIGGAAKDGAVAFLAAELALTFARWFAGGAAAPGGIGLSVPVGTAFAAAVGASALMLRLPAHCRRERRL